MPHVGTKTSLTRNAKGKSRRKEIVTEKGKLRNKVNPN